MNRARFDEALRVACSRLDTADVLNRAPHRAESLRILARGLHALEEAVAQLDPELSAPSVPIRAGDLRALSDLRLLLEKAPEEDALLSRADLNAKRDARRLALRVSRGLRRATRTRQAVMRARFAWLFVLLASISVLAFILRDRFEISASGRYSSHFAAENAIDGNDATEWLAPDRTAAWIELRFKDPIDVAAVRVVNARNAPYNDRATKSLELTLFAGDKAASHVTVTLGLEPAARDRSFQIAATRVTRIRFFARTYYGKGAGFAEVEVIEAGK